MHASVLNMLVSPSRSLAHHSGAGLQAEGTRSLSTHTHTPFTSHGAALPPCRRARTPFHAPTPAAQAAWTHRPLASGSGTGARRGLHLRTHAAAVQEEQATAPGACVIIL